MKSLTIEDIDLLLRDIRESGIVSVPERENQTVFRRKDLCAHLDHETSLAAPPPRQERGEQSVEMMRDVYDVDVAPPAEAAQPKEGDPGAVKSLAQSIGTSPAKKPRGSKQGIKKAPRRSAERDALINKELPGSLKEIGSAVGVSGEAIRRYISRTGQYDCYQRGREKARLMKHSVTGRGMAEAKGVVFQVLETRIAQLAEGAGWAEKKAVAFLQNRSGQKKIRVMQKHNSYGALPRLVELFTRYRQAEQCGEQLSLSKLGEGLFEMEKYEPTVGKILEYVGLDPMFGKQERHITPSEKKAALRRAFSTDASETDVSYFVDLPSWIVAQQFHLYGEREQGLRGFVTPGVTRLLSCRYASQIYQTGDLGFHECESAELLDVPPEMVRYALDNRGIISPGIISLLQKIFDTHEIQRPYLTDSEKEGHWERLRGQET